MILTAGIFISSNTSLKHLKPSEYPTIQDLVNEGWQYHHWFPQQFEREFAYLDIDIHQYTTLLPLELHIALHQMGLDGEGWNENWEDWLYDAEQNGYTADDAVAYLYELLQPYLQQLEEMGITGPHGMKSIVPYPKHE